MNIECANGHCVLIWILWGNSRCICIVVVGFTSCGYCKYAHAPAKRTAGCCTRGGSCMRSLSKGRRAGGRVYSFTAVTQGGGTITCTVWSAVLCAVIYCDICIDVILALADQSGKTVSYSSVYFIHLIAYHLCETLTVTFNAQVQGITETVVNSLYLCLSIYASLLACMLSYVTDSVEVIVKYHTSLHTFLQLVISMSVSVCV